MTIVEALKALREGKRVRNKIWEEHEYIMLENGFIKYGNGVTHRIDVYGEYDMCDDTWEEYKEPVLTDKEKTYLSSFFAPLKKQYSQFTICKLVSNCNLHQKPEYKDMLEAQNTDFYNTYYCKYEFIQVVFGNKVSGGVLNLPNFPKGKYYKGLELNKQYELEEIGL